MKNTRQFLNHFTFFFLVLFLLGASVRFFSFIDKYTVNLLFYDQIFLYETFTHNPSLWKLFTFQYGPHRQGLGYLITWAVANISGWSVQAEVITSSIVQVGTCVLVMLLKRKLFGKWHISDIVIPLVMFSLKYFESFITIPNISHAVLPIFLVFLLALVWTFQSPIKYMLFALVSVITVYTGFGLLTMPFIIFLLFFSLKNEWVNTKNKTFIWFAICVLTFGFISFFFGYYYDTAVSCNENPLINYPKYPVFIGIMLINYFDNVRKYIPFEIFIGFNGFILLFIMSIKKLANLLLHSDNQKKFYEITFFLYGTSVVFITISTIGRTCLGIEAAPASRYMLYVVPAIIAFYFDLLKITSKTIMVISVAVFVLFCFISEHNSEHSIFEETNYYLNKKTEWKTCFINNSSVKECNKETSFEIMPSHMTPVAESVFSYTKLHKLHIFK